MKISVSIKALLSWLQILTSLLSQLPLSLSSSINLPLTGGLVGSCGHPLSLSLSAWLEEPFIPVFSDTNPPFFLLTVSSDTFPYVF